MQNILQKAIFTCTTYTLLVRAKLVSETDDLMVEEPFTYENTSKKQLAKVQLQSIVVERLIKFIKDASN